MQRSVKRASNSNLSIKKEEGESAVKRLKKAPSQTNTLFKYFESNKKIETVADIPKTSLEIIKTESKLEVTDLKTKEPNNEKPETKSFLSLFNRVKDEPKIEIKPKIDFKTNENDENDGSKASIKENSRKCPFYKRIEGTKIVVDAFSYGVIDNANAYFLSHFHYDHFIGLTKHFKQTMYCSQITANLVMKQIKVDNVYIKILEYNKFINVYDNDSDIQVCLVDANHCPGSVMFLFKLNKAKKYILHTGDFRASDELVNNIFNKSIKIDIIYLDTTYLDSYYKFLPQEKIIKLGIDLVKRELEEKPNALIVCGSYTIGKERIFIGIAESLDLKVFVSREKKIVIDCLNDSKLNKRITQNAAETNLHVVQMGKLNIKDLESYASKYGEKFDHVIALKPSGWTHDSNSTTDGLCVVKKSKNIIIYGLEYSEHSSFEELKNCVTTLKPKRVIPTVNIGKKETRDKMTAFLNEWINQ